MVNYLTLNIATVHNPPFKLQGIDYNCPVCDYDIYIDIIVTNNSRISCENCDQIIKLNIKKV